MDNPGDGPEADDDELTEGDGYAPYYLDHIPWTEYEEQDAVGSGDN